MLKVVVTDNGIGRSAAEIINRKRTGHISTGIKNMSERLDLLKKQFKSSPSITMKDLFDEHNNPAGTQVELHLPYIIMD